MWTSSKINCANRWKFDFFTLKITGTSIEFMINWIQNSNFFIFLSKQKVSLNMDLSTCLHLHFWGYIFLLLRYKVFQNLHSTYHKFNGGAHGLEILFVIYFLIYFLVFMLLKLSHFKMTIYVFFCFTMLSHTHTHTHTFNL